MLVLEEAGIGRTTVTRQSETTGNVNKMVIPVDCNKLSGWVQMGESRPLIQQAFPELTADEREFIISGTTPEEWTATFGEEE